jgi:hypothetical protein
MLRDEPQNDAAGVVGSYILGELSERLARVQNELVRTNEDLGLLRAELDAARARLANAS